ncbi:MAG: nucleotidyltransferase family protein [Candidatus Poribacteria bacterium]
MSLEDIIRIVEINRDMLKKLKVKHLSIFGSFARNEQRIKSDIDLLVEFTEPVGFFHFFDVKMFLEKKLNRKVDLVMVDAIRPEFKNQINKELVRAA